MKKLILIFLLLATSLQAQWFTPNPKGLLRLNNTWTGTQTFDSIVANNSSFSGTISANRLAVGGSYYNHVLLAVGYGQHLSTESHQVAVWTPIKGNSYATGTGSFVAGFESGVGTESGNDTLELSANFTVASTDLGVGTTIKRQIGYATYDETATTNHASIAPLNDPFVGSWFIHYNGARASYLGGNLGLGGNLEVTKTVQDSYFKSSSSGDYSRFQVTNNADKGIYAIVYGSAKGDTSYGLLNNNLTVLLGTGNGGMVMGTSLSAPYLFVTNDLERMRIAETGNINFTLGGVSIGTQTVAGTIKYDTGHLYVYNGSTWLQLDNAP